MSIFHTLYTCQPDWILQTKKIQIVLIKKPKRQPCFLREKNGLFIVTLWASITIRFICFLIPLLFLYNHFAKKIQPTTGWSVKVIKIHYRFKSQLYLILTYNRIKLHLSCWRHVLLREIEIKNQSVTHCVAHPVMWKCKHKKPISLIFFSVTIRKIAISCLFYIWPLFLQMTINQDLRH